MKRIIAIILLTALLLAGCGAQDAPGQDGVPTNVPDTDMTIATAEPGNEAQALEFPTISETVLVDESGVKITAKSLDIGDWYGPEIKLLIENNTDTGLTVQCRNLSVNGYMVDSLISCDVASGKKANDGLTIYASSLEQCGIKTIADVEFSFHIFTTDGWDDYLDTAPVVIRTSAADTYSYEYDDSGDLLYQENGITIISKGMYSGDGEQGLSVYIQNESGFPITAQIRDLSINGFMSDCIFSPDIANGKRAISSIKFSSSSIEENEITEIEDVTFRFHVFNSEDWGETFGSEPITITKDGKVIAQTESQEVTESEAETIAITDDKTISIGNIKIPLVGEQVIREVREDGVIASLTPGVSATSVYYSEIGSLSGNLTAALQQAGFAYPSNRVGKEGSYYDIDVLAASVEFTLFATTDGKFWMVGTFYDSQYVYTVSYATNDASERELQNFVDLLGRVELVREGLELTGYRNQAG